MAAAIDTHVHVFRRDGALAADRRYAPNYDAMPEQLLHQMEPAGVGHAVLVQPSFLGTDNSFLLAEIAGRPGAFSGIAVVAPDMGFPELKALRAQGVVGLRLNLIGKPLPDFEGLHRALAKYLGALDMVLQIQAEGAQWLGMERFLSDPPCRVVIDHFGRTVANDASGGFASLLRAAGSSDRVWFKFSAPYRMQGGPATDCASVLLNAVGAQRIVWGSDWPHTQFEGRYDYADTVNWLADWVPDAADRAAILTRNPARLFGEAFAARAGCRGGA